MSATMGVRLAADWLIAMTWQVAVVGAIVWMLDRLWHHRVAWQPLRAALWSLVMLKLILPPTLTSPVSLAHVWDRGEPVPIAQTMTLGPARNVDAAQASDWTSEPFALVIASIWLAGALAAGVALVWRYRRLRRVWLSDLPATLDGGKILRAACRDACSKLGVQRRPRVHVSSHPDVESAAVIGFFRPTIVIPAALVRADRRTALEHVLLHEIAHVRRRDPLAHLVCLALQAIYWFHPIVWIASARLSLLRELACDRAVAAALGGETHHYRRTLLVLARPLMARDVRATGLAFFARRSQLIARLHALEEPVAGRSSWRRALTACACLALLVCVVPMQRPRTPRTVTTSPIAMAGAGDGATPAATPIATSAAESVAAGGAIDTVATRPARVNLQALPGSLQKRYAVLRELSRQDHFEPR